MPHAILVTPSHPTPCCLSIYQYTNLQNQINVQDQSRTGFRRILCSRGSVGEWAGNSTYAGPDDLCTVCMPLSRSASRSTFAPGISAAGVCISYFWSCGISYAGPPAAAPRPPADVSRCRCRRLRRTRQKASTATMTSRPPTPPTIPPTMAPVWL